MPDTHLREIQSRVAYVVTGRRKLGILARRVGPLELVNDLVRESVGLEGETAQRIFPAELLITLISPLSAVSYPRSHRVWIVRLRFRGMEFLARPVVRGGGSIHPLRNSSIHVSVDRSLKLMIREPGWPAILRKGEKRSRTLRQCSADR